MRQVLATQIPAYGRAGEASRKILWQLEGAALEGILLKRFQNLAAACAAPARATGP
jgi:hypothetical protein